MEVISIIPYTASTDQLLGGISFYSARKAFAADSFFEFELVLGSGDIVRANATENTEIWAALAAGENCFGIVTSYSLQTVPATNTLSGVIHYLPESFDQLAEAVVDFIHNETDEQTHVMFSAGYGCDNRVVTCCWYQARGKRNVASLQPFMALPGRMAGQGDLRAVPTSARDLLSSAADGFRYVWQPRMSLYAYCLDLYMPHSQFGPTLT
jgi:FAD/FMN-containing dehydrogenase